MRYVYLDALYTASRWAETIVKTSAVAGIFLVLIPVFGDVTWLSDALLWSAGALLGCTILLKALTRVVFYVAGWVDTDEEFSRLVREARRR